MESLRSLRGSEVLTSASNYLGLFWTKCSILRHSRSTQKAFTFEITCIGATVSLVGDSTDPTSTVKDTLIKINSIISDHITYCKITKYHTCTGISRDWFRARNWHLSHLNIQLWCFSLGRSLPSLWVRRTLGRPHKLSSRTLPPRAHLGNITLTTRVVIWAGSAWNWIGLDPTKPGLTHNHPSRCEH